MGRKFENTDLMPETVEVADKKERKIHLRKRADEQKEWFRVRVWGVADRADQAASSRDKIAQVWVQFKSNYCRATIHIAEFDREVRGKVVQKKRRHPFSVNTSEAKKGSE